MIAPAQTGPRFIAPLSHRGADDALNRSALEDAAPRSPRNALDAGPRVASKAAIGFALAA